MKGMMKVVKRELKALKKTACIGCWIRTCYSTHKPKVANQLCLKKQTSSKDSSESPAHQLVKPEMGSITGPQLERLTSTPPGMLTSIRMTEDNTIKDETRPPVGALAEANEGEITFTPGPSQIILASGDDKRYIALLPDVSLAEQLRKAVSENERLRAAEIRKAQQLDDLDRDFNNLGHDASNVEVKIAEITSSVRKADHTEMERLNCELVELQGTRTKIDEQRQAADRALNEKWRDHSQEVGVLLSLLGDVFAESGLMQMQDGDSPQVDAAVTAVAIEEPGEPTTTSFAHNAAPSSYISSGSRSRYDSDGEYEPRREPSMSELKATDVSNERLEVADKERQADRLRYNYRMQRGRLHAMEMQLEERGEIFDQEALERDRKVATGESAETQVEFDHRMLRLTQAFTQDIAEAEADFEEAKDAAMAAGVQIPEAESGFVDDVNDGYRLSCEDSMKAGVNLDCLTQWLEALPDIDLLLEIYGTSKDRSSSLAEGVEVDDWDARTVDICDSWSVMEIGHARKRIDRWRRACGLA
ncbi:hypothetical protein LTR37_011902 [Vermiconidia calcicola]|uniref:Uncharacterized protein n=1 Tax=Vermiconidia calcicola TaxID=1690605 RepID=A0ACC3N0N0_9PEZI|nr:hypothetical protein LTR37_011902 [Vermiconidia calcicola]